jgi:hypothetical protein
MENSRGAVVAINADSTTSNLPAFYEAASRTSRPVQELRVDSNSRLVEPHNFSQRRMKMRTPNSIAAWCMILFFLLFGLQLLGLAIPGLIIGLLALGVAIFTMIGR